MSKHDDELRDIRSQLENISSRMHRVLDAAYENGQEWQIRDQLKQQVVELQRRIDSVEFRSSQKRAEELDQRERVLKETLTLQYNKGYSDAYTEVTDKMRG